jgi:hypothetical protein
VRLESDREDFLGHFDAEYCSALTEHSGATDVDIHATGPDGDAQLIEAYEGRHKTVSWRVAITGLEEATTRVTFAGSGALVISFLQTFYVEPLIRLKMTGRDHALVHAATLVRGDKSVIFPAGSAVGKSTMMLQHAAAGYQVQGDNYVILTPQGLTMAFPRRLRVYSDLPRINPDVYRLLPLRERFRLRLAGLIRRLSFGYANMPRRLTVDQLVGGGRLCPEARLEAVYLLSPHSGPEVAGPISRTVDEVIERIQAINEAEGIRLREVLTASPGRDSAAYLAHVQQQERDILTRALNGVAAYELLVPRVRNPAQVVAQMRRISGLTEAA